MGIPMWDNDPIDWSRRRETPVPPVDGDEVSERSIAEPGEAEASEEDGPGDHYEVDGRSGGSEGA